MNRCQFVSFVSISSGGSFFSITFSGVHRSALIGFEWNLTFLSTFSADCIMHFSWTIRHSFRTYNSLKELVSSKHQFWESCRNTRLLKEVYIFRFVSLVSALFPSLKRFLFRLLVAVVPRFQWLFYLLSGLS